ncbi:MAG: helix-turn-helix domain-containing protein, partial [Methyloceanibacter sp.]
MNDLEVVAGSGNVFRDLGKPNADLAQARAVLAAKIIGVLDGRKLSLRAAESLTGVDAAEFSRIRSAKLERFTIDRMITILGKLGQEVNVEISVRPMTRRKARKVGGELSIRERRSPHWHGAGARKIR